MMAKLPTKITSEFAMLDVKVGRRGLAQYLRPQTMRVPVIIRGFIEYPWSDDDGESIDFGIDVTSVKIGKPVKVLP
jgi:hypothetical protein